ncbi:oxidoreductase [Actinoplanes sp. N902-109]|uniref:oxidoreductase n=1 Tax=Actinoplanes sp. (strain N902-109) TaxID=649831 RepID=UPI0003293AA9|nr:oxidoreductase [Actinoplanes sp. N902-109]AGL18381.1 short-chain dehydrogenase/reductase SDR [Actinoplanes sp. N902-109]
MSWTTADIPDQHGRVAVVTGANGGLGLASAVALAGRGAHVVLAARDQVKGAAALERLRAVHPGASAELVELDLGSLASVAAAARRIRSVHPAVDLLMNNAGVMAMPQGLTADGFETQLGVNHLGHWALTAHLLPAIVRVPGARVVTVTSGAQHLGRPLDPGDPSRLRDFDPWRAYDDSKLANRHFAQGLDRRFRAAGVAARALTAHPGFTDSGLQATTVAAGGGGRLARFFDALTRRFGMTVERGALSQLRAATDPEAEGGTMYGPRWSAGGPPVARRLFRPGSDAAIETLWTVSQRLTGLDVDVEAALADTGAIGRP